MNAVTRNLPCEPVIDGIPTMLAFTGQDVGPFFIHPGQPDSEHPPRGNWTVSHINTGYSVHKHIRTKARAIRMARQFAKVDCWDFTEAEQSRAISPDMLRLIADIRRGA